MTTKKINILALKIFIVSLSFIILLGCEAETKKNTPIEETPNKISQPPTFEDEQEDVPSDSDNVNLKEDTIKREFSAKVIAVIDGDTIEVLENNNQLRIRLAEIDCPESTQDFGQKASLFTSELVIDKQVKVKVKDLDRYGRSVAEVILPDGRSLNRELLKAGLAWWYSRYSSDPSLGQLQQEAKTSKLGLWSSDSPLPPWDFRHHRR